MSRKGYYEWKAIREKYAISDEENELFKVIMRKRAFEDLDAEIESYVLNDKALDNGGELLDPTAEEVEEILDAYFEYRYSDFAVQDEMDDMRRAIESVTGLVC